MLNIDVKDEMRSKIIVGTDRHTQPTDCCTWTTKVVGKCGPTFGKIFWQLDNSNAGRVA